MKRPKINEKEAGLGHFINNILEEEIISSYLRQFWMGLERIWECKWPCLLESVMLWEAVLMKRRSRKHVRE